jgi:hypothetical protein
MKRSTPLPETATNMQALRELANQSARQAIRHYARRQQRHTVFGKLAVAGISAVVGVFLVCSAPSVLSAQFACGFVAIIGSLSFAYLITKLAVKQVRGTADNSRRESSQLPIDGTREDASSWDFSDGTDSV